MSEQAGGEIQLTVRAFASLRETLGGSQMTITVPSGCDVTGVIAILAERFPESGLTGRKFAVAVNRKYAAMDTALQAGDEVALLPPVSGGSGKLFEITDQPIRIGEVADRVAGPDRGGIALFAGTVRGISGELVTHHLEYEAYAEMAERVLAEIAAEAQQRWPLVSAVSIVHRVGRLEVGDNAVVVAVAAAHRAQTFAACQFIIDRIKEIAPIWKREYGPDGSVWVEGPESLVA